MLIIWDFSGLLLPGILTIVGVAEDREKLAQMCNSFDGREQHTLAGMYILPCGSMDTIIPIF